MKGFTLIEFLTVTVIMGILAAAVLVNYQIFERQFLIERSANKLAQDIRGAGEMARSAKECCGGIIPPGYGIYLQQGEGFYIVYADTNPSKGNEEYDGGDKDDIVKIVNLEQGVEIGNVSPASLSINFRPPSPAIKIKGNNDETIIELVLSADRSIKRMVKVTAAGLIDVFK